MSNEIYGYIRVSSKDQNEDRQRIAMHEAGVDDKHIFWTSRAARTLSVLATSASCER